MSPRIWSSTLLVVFCWVTLGLGSVLRAAEALTVTLNQTSSQQDPTNSSPINFTVIFSEPVGDFGTGDVNLNGTAGATVAVVTETAPKNGTTYQVAVSGMTQSGTVIATIDTTMAHDEAGNPNLASTSSDDTVTYDITSPTAAITYSLSRPARQGETQVITATFSEPLAVASTVAMAIAYTGDIPAIEPTPMTRVEATRYAYNLSMPAGNGTATVSLVGGTDLAGNPVTTVPVTGATFSVDNIGPSVTINQASGQSDPTNGTSIDFAIVFNEPVTDFSALKVNLAGSVAPSGFTVIETPPKDGTTYHLILYPMPWSGTVTATIPEGVVHDKAGNPNVASTSTDNFVTYDVMPPTAAITYSSNPPVTQGETQVITAAFSEPMAETPTVKLAVAYTGGIPALQATPMTRMDATHYSYNLSVPAGYGTGTVSLVAGTDLAGNSVTKVPTSGVTFVVGGLGLTVTINQASGQADPTNSFPILYTIVFSEPVADFGPGDVSFRGSLAPGGLILGQIPPKDGTSYQLSFSPNNPVPMSGTVIAEVAAGVAHDAAGNPNCTSVSTDAAVVYEIVPPTAAITYNLNRSVKQGETQVITAVFSEPMAETPTVKLAVAYTGGIPALQATSMTRMDATHYTYSLSVPAGNGTGTVSLTVGTDLAGNTVTSVPTSGATFMVDNMGPTVTINQTATQADPTGSSPIEYTVVFSETVADFATDDLNLSGTAGATTTVVTQTAPNDGTTYLVTVSGMTQDGTVVASVGPGVAHDAAGNPNVASTSTDNILTYDIILPTAALTYSLNRPVKQGGTQVITAFFSEPMGQASGVKLTVVYTGGIPTLDAAPMARVNATHYTYTLSVPAGNGTGTVSLVAGTDLAGNPVTVEPTSGATFVVDNLAPTATITYSTTAPTNSDVTATLQPSEVVTVTNNGGALTHVFAANGEFTFEFRDPAGNTGTAKATVTNIDKVAPKAELNGTPNQFTPATGADVTVGATEVVLYRFKFDSGSWSGETPATNHISLADLADGVHALAVVGRDAAGNWQAEADATVFLWTVDTHAPTATIAYSTTTLTNTDVTASLQPSETVVVTNNGGTLGRVFAANGEFIFEFQDAAGNTGTARATVTNIDKTAPTGVIAYSTTILTRTDVTATLQPSEPVTVTNNGGALTHVFAANGEFTFEFRDAAGNTGTAKATVTNIDKVAPTASLSGTPNAQTNATTADITVGDADVTLYRFKLDAGVWGDVTPVAEHIALTNLMDGVHTLAVIGCDAAGNWQAEAEATSATWTVDTLAPTATITYSTTAPTNSDVTATLQPSETVTVTNNNGALTHVFAANGEFTFQFQDAAGNTGTAKATVTNIDKIAPTVTINQAAAQVDPTGSSPILFTVVFSEPVADFATGDVSLSGTAGATAATVTEIAPSDGTAYQVTVSGMAQNGTVIASIPKGVAHDAADNPNVVSTRTDNTVTYDTTPPLAFVTYSLDRPTRQGETQEITVVFSEPMADTPAVKLAIAYTGDIPALAATAMTKLDPGHYRYDLTVPAANGTGTVSLAAGTDVAGNPVIAEPTGGVTFVVDNLAPTATIAYTTTAPTNSDVTATLQPSEAVTVTNNSGALTHVFAANGEFAFEFQDAAGNTGTAKATVANIDKVTPTVSLSGTPDAQTKATAADITVGDADVTLYRFKLDAGAWGGVTPVAEHIALTNLVDGAHSLFVIGRDAAGNWQAEAAATSATWTVDTLAPTATITYSTTAPTNSDVTATLQPSETVTVTNNNGALTHVFAANGEFTFQFQDAAGNTGTAKATVANIDKVAPTVTINQAVTQVDPTGSSPILFTAVFSEPVADFATGDVSLGGTAGAAKATVTQVAPNDGTTYRVAVNGMIGNGAVVATIAAGMAHDAAGHPNVTSTSSDNQVEYTIPGNVSAVHSTVGYLPGVLCTVSCTITFSGTTPSALGWVATIPPGWTYAGGNNEPGAKPSVGDQGTLEWTWSAVGTSPIQFAYSLIVPLGETGDMQIPAAVKVRYDDGPVQYAVTPDPLAIHPGLYHSADTGVVSVPPQSNWRIDQDELMRVIQLYNYRAGATRTGEYHVLVATEDGYDLGPGTQTGKPSHSADTGVVDLPAQPNWKINQDELMRVIQLYNYRSGTTRTGEYHIQAGSEDGYAPGPVTRNDANQGAERGVTRGTSGTHTGPTEYLSAGGQITVSCQLSYDGTPTSLGWAATIPDGWAYAAGTNEPGTKPQTGDTGTIEWTWSSIPASPISFSYTLTVPAGQTGDKQVAALSKVRYGGGPTASAVTPNPLVIREKDTTAPTLTLVHVQSNNANSAVARAGDTVTLSFTTNEAIKPPTVTIAGHAVSATQAPGANDWSAAYVMAAVDAEGPVAFRIEFADLADNPGVAVTQTTDGSGVTFMKDWLLTVNVTNADKPSVVFGMHPDAKDTNLVDPMDADCPPAPNPPNAKGGLFFLGLVDDIVVSLARDVRKTKTVERWNLEAVAHSNAMTLSWDKTLVPPGRSLFLWEVNAQGQLVTGTRYNMATTSSLDVPANTVKHMVLFCGPVGFPLVLETGWNMISLPIEPTNPTVIDIFAASRGGDATRQETFTDCTRGGTLHTGEIWMWVPAGSGHYETVTELHALKAYWVHVQSPVTVMVPGTTPATCIANLPKGWNSLGPAKAKLAPYGNPDIWGRAWRWNAVTAQYEIVDNTGLMQPGCGYWIMSRKALSLDLGE